MPCQPRIDVRIWADTASGKRQATLTRSFRIATYVSVLYTISQGLSCARSTPA